MKKYENYEQFAEKLTAFLTVANKDLAWLSKKIEVQQTSLQSWINGNKNPDIDNIHKVAKALRELQVNIITPKQLIPLAMEINIGDSQSVKTNIKWLCTRFNLSASAIYSDTLHCKIPKNSVLNLLNRDNQPHSKNLCLWADFFKAKKIGQVESCLDLFYFPEWGENEKSYLELKGKIKKIE